jgi:hypothetical protein
VISFRSARINFYLCPSSRIIYTPVVAGSAPKAEPIGGDSLSSPRRRLSRVRGRTPLCTRALFSSFFLARKLRAESIVYVYQWAIDPSTYLSTLVSGPSLTEFLISYQLYADPRRGFCCTVNPSAAFLCRFNDHSGAQMHDHDGRAGELRRRRRCTITADAQICYHHGGAHMHDLLVLFPPKVRRTFMQIPPLAPLKVRWPFKR